MQAQGAMDTDLVFRLLKDRQGCTFDAEFVRDLIIATNSGSKNCTNRGGEKC
jgi:hypothetical protein